jgi:hypothetical protein
MDFISCLQYGWERKLRSIYHYNIKYYDGCSCTVVITWEAYSVRHSFAAFVASAAFVAEFEAIFEVHPPKLHLSLFDRLLFLLVVEPLSVDQRSEDLLLVPPRE